MRLTSAIFLWLLIFGCGGAYGEAPVGYYRQPALSGNTIVFVAEGDLWTVALTGGVATRLTSHPGSESEPAISADGRTVAFAARYEGPRELYTMPLEGGRPTRRTFESGEVAISGWTADGRVLFSTPVYSTLPNWQLVAIDVRPVEGHGPVERIPLSQAADGCFAEDGRTLFFTRLRFQGSHTKRYKGGTAQNLWRFDGTNEAVPLTSDYAGTSKRPMVWQGRVYFVSDRDGSMNLWSMNPDGGDLRQHTRHNGWDVASPYLHDGKIVYQLGADLHAHEIATGEDRLIPITLDSDLDQTRENWIEKPAEYISSGHVSSDGNHVAITARGQVFVAPRKRGRFVEATRAEGVRYRDARFLPDGESLVTLSDESGEVELWRLPANGVGPAEQLTDNGDVLRWEIRPSPDGKWIAHHDKNQRLHLLDLEKKTDRLIDENAVGDFSDLTWSPDSKWLAYVASADNLFAQIKLFGIASEQSTAVTSDRYDSYSPAWSTDGKWLYMLSDRDLVSLVGNPWGNYQPEPYLDKTARIFHVALTKGLRSPFASPDELHDDGEKDKKEGKKAKEKKKGEDDGEATPETVVVEIDLQGIQQRLQVLPIPRGNYEALRVQESALFWLSRETGSRERSLSGVTIGREKPEPKTIVKKIRDYEISLDGKHLLVRKEDQFYLLDAKPDEADLEKKNVDLSGWTLSLMPREEWRQMFDEAWRLERDYFYDRGMHGVDWPAMREKYRPLVDRVTTREELSDLIAQLVSELSALHIFVRGGDRRESPEDIPVAQLGARLVPDEEAGGYRVDHVYLSDPDEPERGSPLARPGVDVVEGDVIEKINGTPTLSVADIHLLLRNQANRQVLLRVRPGGGGEPRDVIIEPIDSGDAWDLRYHEWEHTRRLEVEERGAGEIGYLHLRAMGGRNYTEWAKGFYPVFMRKGLIIDVRGNRGGNIDSWIIGRLLRKAWFGWSQRVGQSPSWNMQYAFRGHVVVLCDEHTASDGEAFAEGVKRLDLGTVVGTRTWGGEIWLTSSNFLVDRGIATSAEFGVFGPAGEWLIEGHGVEPHMVVDNLPHATANGSDAQLEAAIEFLQRKIAEEPIEELSVPRHPDKSFDY